MWNPLSQLPPPTSALAPFQQTAPMTNPALPPVPLSGSATSPWTDPRTAKNALSAFSPDKMFADPAQWDAARNWLKSAPTAGTPLSVFGGDTFADSGFMHLLQSPHGAQTVFQMMSGGITGVGDTWSPARRSWWESRPQSLGF